jgi:tripartite ATP-independent transporter DctM subunit
MGMIIPPSVPMIIYALVSEESVGKLFLGSLIPGVMIGLLMLGITIGISYRKKYPREEIRLTRAEKLQRTRQSLLALIMPVFVVGAVVFGIATATESAGIGVLYAFIIGALVLRNLKMKMIPPLMRDAIITSANVMVIIALSKLYIWILALERIPMAVAGFISGLDLPVFLTLLAIDLIILMTGTFVDVSPAILLLTPVFLPSMAMLEVSRIQFGVILISGLAVGLVTPPVGMCLNVASAISRLGIGTIFKAALPFLMANIITLLLITYIPQLCLWLPTLLFE